MKTIERPPKVVATVEEAAQAIQLGTDTIAFLHQKYPDNFRIVYQAVLSLKYSLDVENLRLQGKNISQYKNKNPGLKLV